MLYILKYPVFLTLIFSLRLANSLLLGVTDTNKSVEPTAYFSAVFWDKYQKETFTYAPWGNENEENASMVSIAVNSNSLSRKFAFYGSDKINLFTETNEETSTTEKIKNIAMEFELPLSTEKGREYILLFLNKKKNGLWKIYPVPFLKDDIPVGSFKFVSQLRSTIYLLFGKEKITLSSGKSSVSPGILEEGKRGINLKAMMKKDGRFVNLYDEDWSYSSRMRGMFFLGMNGSKLNVKRLVEFNRPLVGSLGYGVPPFTNSADK